MVKQMLKKKRQRTGRNSNNSKLHKNQRSAAAENDDAKLPAPPAAITEIVGNVKYKYRYLETVHSMEELDALRFQNNCKFGNAKRRKTFKKAVLWCTNRSEARGMCPFSLSVRKLTPESNRIHVYVRSEHNHPVKPEAERAAHQMAKQGLMPDAADPPANFTAPDGRQWTLLGTAANANKMDKFRLKHHCICGKNKQKQSRFTLKCTTRKCQFRLLALKTDGGRCHVYRNGRHTCQYAKNDKNEAKPGEMQAEEEEEVQMDVAEESLERMEEERQDGTAETAGPAKSSSGDIEEAKEEWQIEKIQRRMARALREGRADKVNKWMARTGPGRIGTVLTGLDIEQVVKLLKMASKALRGKDGENVSIWLGWIKTALTSRGLELAEVPGLVDGLLSRILKRIELRELLSGRKLKTFRKRLATMREHMQQNSSANAGPAMIPD